MASKLHNIENKNLVSMNNNARFNNKRQPENKKRLIKKELLHKLFHPDYILFDWEYFSRELEFE